MDKRRVSPDVYEWHPRTVLVPRIGMLVTRHDANMRLILPGRYMVRRSRTMGQMVYRRVRDMERAYPTGRN
ncbi:hypothetical protein MNQ96_01350 [Sphingopyxis granuli]|uniref:hypothetical protein n=1 Tax=Sphingopyxis granuli TaxID=267128 RepID=UPI001F53304D|nr:hypothetical protein [Sphingopyxis granuli]UNK79769.1 hypothetical protein MNQ96_01350 [Sphingopyxis granuli]